MVRETEIAMSEIARRLNRNLSAVLPDGWTDGRIIVDGESLTVWARNYFNEPRGFPVEMPGLDWAMTSRSIDVIVAAIRRTVALIPPLDPLDIWRVACGIQ